MGVGKAFFAELAKVAEEKVSTGSGVRDLMLTLVLKELRSFGLVSFEGRDVCIVTNHWLTKSCYDQWNQPSIDFYEKRLGAQRMSDWVGMRLDEKGIADLKNLV